MNHLAQSDEATSSNAPNRPGYSVQNEQNPGCVGSEQTASGASSFDTGKLNDTVTEEQTQESDGYEAIGVAVAAGATCAAADCEAGSHAGFQAAVDGDTIAAGATAGIVAAGATDGEAAVVVDVAN